MKDQWQVSGGVIVTTVDGDVAFEALIDARGQASAPLGDLPFPSLTSVLPEDEAGLHAPFRPDVASGGGYTGISQQSAQNFARGEQGVNIYSGPESFFWGGARWDNHYRKLPRPPALPPPPIRQLSPPRKPARRPRRQASRPSS